MGAFELLNAAYHFTFFHVVLLAAAIIGLVVANVAWRRHHIPGARYLAMMELASALWTFAIIFESSATSIPLKFIWVVLSYPGMTSVPIFYLLFVLEFTGRGRSLTPSIIVLLFAIPFLLVIGAVTNEWHGLLWTSISVDPVTNAGDYHYGPLHILLVIIIYLAIPAGIVMLLRARNNLLVASSRQIWMMVILSFLTLLALTGYFAGFDTFLYVDWTPLGISGAGVALAWALFRGHVFNLLPIAREQLLDSMSDGVIVVDRTGRIVDINPAVTYMLNMSQSGVLGKTIEGVIANWPGLNQQADGSLTVEVDNGLSVPGSEVVRATEACRYIDIAMSEVLNKRQRPIGRMFVLRDVTASRMTEQALVHKQELTRALLDSLVDGVIGCDATGKLVLINRIAREWHGMDVMNAGPEVWASHSGLYQEDGVTPMSPGRNPLIRALHGETFHGVGMAMRSAEHASQPMRFLRASGGPFQDTAGAILGAVVALEDVTFAKHASEALVHEQYLMRVLMDSVPDAIYFKDAESRFIRINQAAAAQLGLSDPSDGVGRTLFDFFAPTFAQSAHDDDKQVFLTGQPIIGKEEAIERDGMPVQWVSTTKMPLRDQAGIVIGTFGISRDITESKAAEDNLRYISVHDALTGLYNRAYFNQSWRQLQRVEDFPLSTVMIDVDHMKETNDTHGHAAGDDLLIRTGIVLRSTFRGDDIIARIGGDEFAVLLPHTDYDAALLIFERLKQKLVEHNAAFDGMELSLSTGVATARDPGDLPATLSSADQMMYREKSHRHNRASAHHTFQV